MVKMLIIVVIVIKASNRMTLSHQRLCWGNVHTLD